MQPNNPPQPVAGPQPATSPPPAQTIKPNSNSTDAAAVFFTLLIVGFTFHLPGLLYIPVLFFCIVAGVLFFREYIGDKAGR